ncbi:MAG: FHA domain-containing protein [Anaerolineaceae bacterium]|nr:FHA domain-containing protein [Anaerolineaceae bacterium]
MSKSIPRQPHLVLLRGNKRLDYFSLSKPILSIGRAPDNDIVIDDSSVSRYHARMYFQNDQWIIEDLGSNNGVWINGVRINRPTFLPDDIRFSLSQSVKFQIELQPDVPLRKKQPEKSSKWILPAGLIGLGIGAIVVLALGAMAYFNFGFWAKEPLIQAEEEDIIQQPTIIVSQEEPVAQDIAEEYTQTIPEVVVMEPGPALHIPLASAFQVKASAYDSDGIIRMELWVDDQLALTLSSPTNEGLAPFYLNQDMLGTSEGTFSLHIRAYDKLGNMGESIAYNITVSAGLDPDKEPVVYYQVEEGDTIQEISVKIDSDVKEIKKANPGLDKITEEKLIVLPDLLLKDQDLSNLPPKEKIPLIGLNPIVPDWLGNLQPDEPGAQLPGVVLPVYFPDPKSLPNLAQMPRPEGLQSQVTDCKVTLSWQFSSPEAQTIEIFRRAKPGQLKPQFVKELKPEDSSFTDTVFPGEYEYTVEAVGKKINNSVERSRSLPLNVIVKPTADCIENPEKMRILFFKANAFSSHDPMMNQVSIYYSPLGVLNRRLPSTEGMRYSVGTWSVPIESFPLPASLYLNPDQPFVFEVHARGWTMDQVVNGEKGYTLGKGFTSIDPKEILDIGLKNWIAQGSTYAFSYKLWSSDLQWSSRGWVTSGTSGSIAAPTNLKLSENDPTFKTISFDWVGDRKAIDGFILYRSYSCPGRGTVIQAPLFGESLWQYMGIHSRNEPAGCAYRYEMSAYGRYGESPRSKPLEGITRTTNQIVKITFETLKVNNLPSGPTRGQVDITANANTHSGKIWLDEKLYSMNNIPMDGLIPNNQITVFVEEKQDIFLDFSIRDINHMLNCGAQMTLKADEIKNLTKTEKRTLSNSKQCEMVVSISPSQEYQIPGGSRAPIETDLYVKEIKRLGFEVFANIDNDGSKMEFDDARFLLQASWGEFCEGKPPLIIGKTEHWVNTGGGTPPGLFYIDPQVDLYISGILQKPENKSSCPRKLKVSVTPVDNGTYASYIDTREDNNETLFDIEILRK